MVKIMDVLKDTSKFTKLVCKVSGVTFDGRQEVIKKMTKDTMVFVDADVGNQYDRHAVKVYALLDGELEDVGFVPSSINETLFNLLLTGVEMETTLVGISQPKTDKDFYGLRISIDVKNE